MMAAVTVVAQVGTKDTNLCVGGIFLLQWTEKPK
jgi:hypothetical protein